MPSLYIHYYVLSKCPCRTSCWPWYYPHFLSELVFLITTSLVICFRPTTLNGTGPGTSPRNEGREGSFWMCWCIPWCGWRWCFPGDRKEFDVVLSLYRRKEVEGDQRLLLLGLVCRDPHPLIALIIHLKPRKIPKFTHFGRHIFPVQDGSQALNQL